MHVLKTVFFILFAGLTLVFATPAATAAGPVMIDIGVSDNLASRIIRTLEEYPDACARDDFFSKGWLRTTLEFMIVCRAIRLGGLEAEYAFTNYPNSARAREEIKKGSVMIIVDFPWGDFSKGEEFYQSVAVLPVGSFVKGLYTRPGHTAMLKVKTLEELKSFTAVSSETWRYDWAALEQMNVNAISVPQYVQMGEMVDHGRADFFVGEFPGADDLSQYVNGIRFIPVPGVKIVLPGSRHVAVSKKFAHSKQVFDALQSGLRHMHERGLIEKGYRISGFFNPRVENWKALCCKAPAFAAEEAK